MYIDNANRWRNNDIKGGIISTTNMVGKYSQMKYYCVYLSGTLIHSNTLDVYLLIRCNKETYILPIKIVGHAGEGRVRIVQASPCY